MQTRGVRNIFSDAALSTLRESAYNQEICLQHPYAKPLWSTLEQSIAVTYP